VKPVGLPEPLSTVRARHFPNVGRLDAGAEGLPAQGPPGPRVDTQLPPNDFRQLGEIAPHEDGPGVQWQNLKSLPPPSPGPQLRYC
jgi:hypothetical protein